MVEETARRTIGCVHWAQETYEKTVQQTIIKKTVDRPHASGNNFRTVVVLSSAKNAPRCMHLKWLIYRCQFSFSATIVKPDACWRSSPVGETKFPVARKLESLAPTSKLTFDKTFVK
jgi:hypothetical protein